MSRSGYSDDLDNWDLIRYRGAVTSALKGRRGQAFLKELAEAMDAMPEKDLIAGELVDAEGKCCALGVLGTQRGLDLKNIDPEDPDEVAEAFGVANALAREIVYLNDEYAWCQETPEDRWKRMRKWVAENLRT